MSNWMVPADPCFNRQAGQRPPRAPKASGAPHCGHLFSRFGLFDSFIQASQKQNREDVTKKVEVGAFYFCLVTKAQVGRDRQMAGTFRFWGGCPTLIDNQNGYGGSM